MTGWSMMGLTLVQTTKSHPHSSNTSDSSRNVVKSAA
jgi:hypothetical protein